MISDCKASSGANKIPSKASTDFEGDGPVHVSATGGKNKFSRNGVPPQMDALPAPVGLSSSELPPRQSNFMSNIRFCEDSSEDLSEEPPPLRRSPIRGPLRRNLGSPDLPDRGSSPRRPRRLRMRRGGGGTRMVRVYEELPMSERGLKFQDSVKFVDTRQT